jgi:hypothetical protein
VRSFELSARRLLFGVAVVFAAITLGAFGGTQARTLADAGSCTVSAPAAFSCSTGTLGASAPASAGNGGGLAAPPATYAAHAKNPAPRSLAKHRGS